MFVTGYPPKKALPYELANTKKNRSCAKAAAQLLGAVPKVGLIVGIRHAIFSCAKKSPVIEGVAGTAVPSQGSGLIGQPTKNESGNTNVDEKKAIR